MNTQNKAMFGNIDGKMNVLTAGHTEVQATMTEILAHLNAKSGEAPKSPRRKERRLQTLNAEVNDQSMDAIPEAGSDTDMDFFTQPQEQYGEESPGC